VPLVFPKAGIFLQQPRKLFSQGMVAFANAAEVRWNWSTTTSYHFHAVAKVLWPIFSCSVKNVTGANQTVVIVKFITEK
jgi:hypothetical protein